MGYSKAHRRKGHSIRKRRTRGGGSSGAHASSGHLFSPRSGLSAAVAASLVIALASLAYMHWRSSDHGGQERAARLKTTAALDEAGGTERVTENTIEGSFAASRRIRRWGFQSKDEAFRVLDGQGTAATGGGMPEGVPGGWEAKANRTGGGSGGNDKGHGELRKPPKSEREAFSEGRGEISERATEEGLRVQSRKTGWLSAVQNLALGSFSRAHRASETIREPPAIERRGDAIVEPVGGVDGEAAGGLVPEWVRPTTQELEDIVRTQFGPWRTLSDASPEAFANGSVDASNRRHGSSEGCFPMRQGMAPYLEEHLRRCYAAMRQGYQFGAPLRQVAVVTMGEHKDVKASPRGVVALMSTSRPNDLKNLMKSLRTLSRNFLDDHAYPVAIIHEDFSTELMESLRDIVPVPIHFVEVEFKLPDWMEPLSWIYPLAVKHYTGHPKSMPLVGFHSDMHGMLPYVKRGNFGYFHMCRFFGGAGYMLPFFDNFDLYLRLDSDSFCSERLPDYFMKLEKAGADYAFDSTFLDFGDKAQGLWNFAERYMRDRNVSPTFWKRSKSGGQISKVLAKANERPPYPKCSNQSPQEETVVSIQGTKIHPVPCRDRHFQAVPAFYTNFEVARIKMLRSSWYQDWFNAIDKTGSIYYSRWGDAPIRFIGLSMHLPESKILKVSGCRHD